ncbi:MAG: DUF4394 domain-containing protein [Gemmata sp.]
MFTRLPSRPRRIAPVDRPGKKTRHSALGLEPLEAREVPATLYALADNNVLLRFDSAAPTTVQATTTVTGLGAGETLQGIDFRPRTGQLFGSTAPTGSSGSQTFSTYSINPLTSAATLVGTGATVTNGSDTAGGYDFNPTVDRIRYVNDLLANARLNPTDGALAGNDTPISLATFELIGAAYDRNTDRQTPGSTTPTTLYAIDRASSSLVRVGGIDGSPSPNGGVVTVVGALGVTLAAGSDAGFDIFEAVGPASGPNNNGLGVAYATLTTADGVTRLYTIDLTTGAATVVGAVGAAGATATVGLAAAPEGTLVVGSGPGVNGDVRLLDPSTGTVRAGVVPFAGFAGGVRVATGDVNGDGVPDAVVAAVQAANGHVKVFDGTTGAELLSFFAFEGFNGSVNVGSGDVNGDGFADVLVVASGANGHVKAFSGRDGSQMSSFFAYPDFLGSVTVSAGDFDNNGTDEIVTAAAINGHTKVFTAAGAAFAAASLPSFQNSFFAFSPYLGDVSLAVGDVTGDGVADFVLGSAGGPLNVQVVNGSTFATAASFLPAGFGAGTTGGTVTVADSNRDGRYEIDVAPSGGAAATVRSFDLLGNQIGSFPAFAGFQGAVSAAGTRF